MLERAAAAVGRNSEEAQEWRHQCHHHNTALSSRATLLAFLRDVFTGFSSHISKVDRSVKDLLEGDRRPKSGSCKENQAGGAAVAFVRRPFLHQLELELEPTATSTSSPRSSNSILQHQTLHQTLLSTLPHHGLFGPGYRCAGRFAFSPPLSVTQLKVTGLKQVSRRILPKSFSAKQNHPFEYIQDH